MAEIPLNISFTDSDPSDAVTFLVQERAEKLGQQFDKVVSCHVFISRPSHRTRQKLFNVRIHLVIPGKEFEANREVVSEDGNGEIRSAIDAAFDHITRELRDYKARQRDQHRHRG